ncbi:hypothetical protein EKN56_11850 [Limnobaculum zhutongyuii]|uniref:DUF6484 domain-containing protein n=1 Tax=Limnobaculum zhutongyuii TaxID=2498113 RepID=A0A411WLK4_9GAMM|nr:DUF6484 domain-containing protein [Limnobaculum zhutongyuii]QBH97027.1 hypothetical protein EKN56_11850 [Limnobaculum zhutongyuii]TQS87423.1 hypothetical protein ELQ32_13960 [Limnobaculum zhutongyuii]
MIKEKISKLNRLFTYTTLGRLVDFKDDKHPVVEISDGTLTETHLARSCIKLTKVQLGSEVVLLLVGDNSPVITGVIEAEPVEIVIEEQAPIFPKNVITVDGHVLDLKATERISLQCGQARITLTKDGKITIKGKYLLSRAKGSNRIQGGSVELN